MNRIILCFLLCILAGCGPDDSTSHRRMGDAKPSGSWAPTAPSGYFIPGTPAMPYPVNTASGQMLVDANVTGGSMTVVTVSGGSAATTSFGISGGTVNTVPNSYPATLGALTVTSTVSVPAGSKTVTVWGNGSLLIGGGTVTAPASPATLPITGGTMGVSGGTVQAVFGG